MRLEMGSPAHTPTFASLGRYLTLLSQDLFVSCLFRFHMSEGLRRDTSCVPSSLVGRDEDSTVPSPPHKKKKEEKKKKQATGWFALCVYLGLVSKCKTFFPRHTARDPLPQTPGLICGEWERKMVMRARFSRLTGTRIVTTPCQKRNSVSPFS